MLRNAIAPSTPRLALLKILELLRASLLYQEIERVHALKRNFGQDLNVIGSTLERILRIFSKVPEIRVQHCQERNQLKPAHNHIYCKDNFGER